MVRSIAALVILFSSVASGTAQAEPSQNLDGVWRLQDNSAIVRVAKCPKSKNWCATVIEERLAAGESSQLNQMIVREMRPAGKQGWTGQYVLDGQTMKATAKLLRPDRLAYKVCALAFLCETIRLERVRR
jgi:uncharacterized protein (DUF2147 family)